MSSTNHKAWLATLTLTLAACGGGGGGSASTTTTLSATVGSLSSSHITVGSAATLTGSQVIASAPSVLHRLMAMLIPTVQADSLSSCSSSALVNSSDGATWETLGLTASTDTPPCVKQSQDAGQFLILETSALVDANGKTCDLVAIRKSTGATTCLAFNIPRKSEVGALTFYLDESSGQTPGQLTLNGKHFFVGFKATKNVTPAVHGFVRIDLDGAAPTGFTAFARVGTTSSADYDDIGGYTPFFSPFYGLENGDMTVNLWKPDVIGGRTGSQETHYVVVDKTKTDATQMTSIRYNETPVTADNGYSVNMSSGLGQWYKANVDSNATAVDYNNDAFSTPLVAGERAIYFTVGANPARSVVGCGSQARTLVKATFNPSEGTVAFEDRGVSGLTSGLGTNYLTNNVTPNSDGTALLSLYLYKVDATHVKIVQSSKSLSDDSCSVETDVETGIVADTALTDTASGSNMINAFTFRTADTVFLQTFNFNPEDNGNDGCLASSGCPVNSYDAAFSFDIAAGTISPIDISLIQQTDYRVSHAYSSVTGQRVTLRMVNTSNGASQPMHAEIGRSEITSLIKFPVDASVSQAVINGNDQ